MTIVVTGAGGMLGQAVVKAAKAAGHPQVVGYTHEELDITDAAALRRFGPSARSVTTAALRDFNLGGAPVTIINCAGIVRGRHPAWTPDATLVNAQAPHKLAARCDRLVQVSTDCVFNGALGPGGAIPTYNEMSPTCPTDWYGETKVAGEVRDDPHVTVRGSFIGFDSGLLAWFLAHPEEATVPGYTDHIWTGTYVADYADALVAIASTDLTGVTHLVAPRTTKAILLREIGDLLRPDIYVDAQTAPDGPRHMDLRSTRWGLPGLPDWHVSLRRLARDHRALVRAR